MGRNGTTSRNGTKNQRRRALYDVSKTVTMRSSLAELPLPQSMTSSSAETVQALEACFLPIHRLGTPENPFGDEYDGSSEVQVPDPPDRLLALLADTDVYSFQQYTLSKIVWLSDTYYLHFLDLCLNDELQELLGCSKIVNVRCEDCLPCPRYGDDWEIVFSVCQLGNDAPADSSCHAINLVLSMMRALRVPVLQIYGDTMEARNGMAWKSSILTRGNDELSSRQRLVDRAFH